MWIDGKSKARTRPRQLPVNPKHHHHVVRTRTNLRFACQLAIVAFCWVRMVYAAGPDEAWDVDPYQIQISLAIDAPGDLAQQLADELPAYVRERAAASIGSLWRLETELATGATRHQMLTELDSITTKQLAAGAPEEDKRMLVAVQATPWGYSLAAREYDRYVERWGNTRRMTTRQRDAIPEQLFDLIRQTFAPVAHFRSDDANKDNIVLDVRGAAIPTVGPDFTWATAGDVYLPLFRRTNRDGQLLRGGIQKMPWTYVEVTGVKDQQVAGRLQSATRKSIGTRRGRFEQVAIALRVDPQDTVMRLRSRTQANKPLIGYEIDVRNTDDESPKLVGLSDEEGRVTVRPGKTAIQLVYAKNAGELLARLPIVPGLDEHVNLPLPDVDVRLRAEARLSSLREDLVDVVARRNIVISRVKQLIEDKDYARAKQLLDSLDELPGRSQFSQMLDREARTNHSSDPMVQKRIDELFTATQTVLGQYLDPRPIGELHDALRNAQKKGT
jgi:hypothetical protein